MQVSVCTTGVYNRRLCYSGRAQAWSTSVACVGCNIHAEAPDSTASVLCTGAWTAAASQCGVEQVLGQLYAWGS
jgi:hypothetical protein